MLLWNDVDGTTLFTKQWRAHNKGLILPSHGTLGEHHRTLLNELAYLDARGFVKAQLSNINK
jgi:hypothetical protein